jgi:hypothetical protein
MSFSFVGQSPNLQTPIPPPPYLPPQITESPPSTSTAADLTSFRAILYRGSNPESVESMCRQLIKKYTSSNDIISLYHLYGVIRETREVLLERDLTYIQLYVWYEENMIWGATALGECVYTYGCWKDIKYLCEYCRKNSGRTDHPFILYAICLLDQRLKEDWAFFVSDPPQVAYISQAAKWTPREKSKYGWIYTILSVGYYGYLTEGISKVLSLKQKEGALNKSKLQLRKVLSTLNKHLDTLEIKLCKNYWDYINPVNVPIYATFKYHRSFYRHGVEIPVVTKYQKKDYPYSNIKKLADTVNKDCVLDSEMEEPSTSTSILSLNNPSKNPMEKTSKEYRQNFDNMVSNFFGFEKGKALSIIDVSTLTKEDIHTCIGWTCVECDGAMILTPGGKYQFFSFSSLSFCERVQELSTHFATFTKSTTTTTTTTTTTSHLKSVCLFMEKCFNETTMDESDRTRIKFFVFSRHSVTELEDICKKDIFEMKL